MTLSTPALEIPASLARGKNIITIASGKGGVGKTWLAITLAHALARSGRRTLLFDGDLGLANVDIQLGLAPERDLGGVIAGRLSLCNAVAPFPDGGFDIIAGRSGSGHLSALHPTRLAMLRDDLIAVSGGGTTTWWSISAPASIRPCASSRSAPAAAWWCAPTSRRR